MSFPFLRVCGIDLRVQAQWFQNILEYNIKLLLKFSFNCVDVSQNVAARIVVCHCVPNSLETFLF